MIRDQRDLGYVRRNAVTIGVFLHNANTDTIRLRLLR